jgi:hypothetical protein
LEPGTQAGALLVPAHGEASLEFVGEHTWVQCVGLRIAVEPGCSLLVKSVKVGAVEQLLGEGLPAEFLGLDPLRFDRQHITASLTITLQNDGDEDAHAGISVAFEDVTAVMRAKVWH